MRRSLLLVALALAGCGGGDDDDATAPPPPTAGPPAVTVTQPEDTAQAEPSPTGKPTFEITLTAESAKPSAGKAWRYVVTAKATDGGRADGTTAKMRVFVGDELVDTLGFFAFEDRLTRTHVWPAILKGKRNVMLQAEVEGEGGTQRANFPVTVR